MSVYGAKAKFQALLRPLAGRLAGWGLRANQVTVFAAIVSVAVGAVVALNAGQSLYFLPIALWLPVRMALNAIDGMLAKEFGQKSTRGLYLNEIGDVVSDAALYLPFALVPPFGPFWVGAVIVLSGVSELAGVLGATIGASRRYDGPAGKADRAVLFGVLALAIALFGTLPHWVAWTMPALAALLCVTIVNRVRRGLDEASSRGRSS